MQTQWKLFVTAPMLLALTAGAAAQMTEEPRTQPGARPGAIAEAPKTNASAQQDQKLLRSSKVVGAAVHGAAGEKVAEINDLIVDTQRGRVAYAVAGKGGVLGIGDELHVIPWDAVKVRTDTRGDKLAFTFEQDRLMEGGPMLKRGEHVDMSDPAWNDRVFRHYEQEPYWKHDRRAGALGDRPGVDDDQIDAMARMKMHRLSEILDADVQNLQDNDLGDLEEVVIDSDSGRVAFAVIAAGGFLGIGEEYAAVPFNALDLRPEDPDDADDDDLVAILNMDEERFRQAPKFARDNWPDFGDRTWGEPVHRYYGTEPYWLDDDQEGGMGAGGAAIGGAGALDSGQELFRTGESTTVTGTVGQVQEGQRIQGVGEGVHMTIVSDSGPVLVHLAPRSHLDKKGLTINQGDQVKVEGKRVFADGREIVLARTVKIGENDQVELRDDDGRPVWEGGE